jgi:hypothetical protein
VPRCGPEGKRQVWDLKRPRHIYKEIYRRSPTQRNHAAVARRCRHERPQRQT